MIPFDQLANAIAQWRSANGLATQATTPTAASNGFVAAPVSTVISPVPDSGKNKWPAAANPPATVTREFTDVPEDAIEEDGPDYAMSFDDGGAGQAQGTHSEAIEADYAVDETVVGGD